MKTINEIQELVMLLTQRLPLALLKSLDGLQLRTFMTDGLRTSIKEDMKDGYKQTSDEYERKLRMQADEFLNQERELKGKKDNYEKLPSEFEEYIQELERKCAGADLERNMKGVYGELKWLKTA